MKRTLSVATGLIGLLTGFTAVLPSPTEAACTRTIYAERAETDGTNTQVLGRVSSVNATLWFATTDDPEFARIIAAAVAQRNRLEVTGDAANCQGIGNVRDLGKITRLTQQP
jgi:hypothetical protein